ncbi:MAG: S8 family serine peptidase [Gelidibacter sp.]
MKTITRLFLLFPIILFSQGNPAMLEANVDDVYTQFNLSGNGVIYAMLDRGVDYTHPAYLNPDGTTRIKYIFDMINPAGAATNGYGYGTIFTEDQINASLAAGGTPLSTDRGGHGTATTGIASGNGGGTVNREFKGVAYEASLIIVKMVQDAFPAFDGQPGQGSVYNPSYIPVALQFVHDKVTELGMPSVTLMNIGSVGGPTDGTSTICRAIDDFISQGHIFVCGVGDDGGNDNHAAGTIAQGETVELLINKNVAGNLRMDLWYSENDRFSVAVELPNGTVYGPYAAPSGPNVSADVSQSAFFMAHKGANLEYFGATSNRRELLIDFYNTTGTYKIRLTGTTVVDGGFHATLNPANFSYNNKFASYVVEGSSINDFSSAMNVISPGDYVIQRTWTDINGIPRSRPIAEGLPGEIWLGSSKGPTQDGRLGIDFVAPGEIIFAPYSPNSYYSSFSFNQVQGGNGLYGIQTAVSAAAPLSTGVIALMLQLDPTLTNDEVKTILQQSAREDSFTGTVPNITFGYGKLDALAAVQMVNEQLSVEEQSIGTAIKVFPNPVTNRLNIHSRIPIETISMLSIEGKEVLKQKGPVESIDMSSLQSGIYILRIYNAQSTEVMKVVKSN